MTGHRASAFVGEVGGRCSQSSYGSGRLPGSLKGLLREPPVLRVVVPTSDWLISAVRSSPSPFPSWTGAHEGPPMLTALALRIDGSRRCTDGSRRHE